ncbi:MAG: polysulfide reductase NrfD [Desulfovibrionaceae bacterium]|nr:polysulfide reductase NrfD [Desulfovibrionaceae bacterium]
MLELALRPSPRFRLWLAALAVLLVAGLIAYLVQSKAGLSVTGLSRDVSWGLYISQFTYFVGVAAGAVMLLLPTYFHHYQDFKKLIILGEFMAVAAVGMCLLFIFADLGQPQRILNILLHPSPKSVMFWDMLALSGYLLLNLVIGWTTLKSEQHDLPPPPWIKRLIWISIFWAFSIHTVTGFLYAGLPGRPYWFTAIMVPRFLASAFCSGPAILLLLCLALKKLAGFTPGDRGVRGLTTIITYALGINIFFYAMELFTAFYSGIPGHARPIVFLFSGHEGQIYWINYWMWACAGMGISSLFLLLNPQTRHHPQILPWSLGFLVTATWIDKSLGLIIGGFTPNTFGGITEYIPSLTEICITLGVYAAGLILLSVLWKIVLEVRRGP